MSELKLRALYIGSEVAPGDVRSGCLLNLTAYYGKYIDLNGIISFVLHPQDLRHFAHLERLKGNSIVWLAVIARSLGLCDLSTKSRGFQGDTRRGKRSEGRQA